MLQRISVAVFSNELHAIGMYLHPSTIHQHPPPILSQPKPFQKCCSYLCLSHCRLAFAYPFCPTIDGLLTSLCNTAYPSIIIEITSLSSPEPPQSHGDFASISLRAHIPDSFDLNRL